MIPNVVLAAAEGRHVRERKVHCEVATAQPLLQEV